MMPDAVLYALGGAMTLLIGVTESPMLLAVVAGVGLLVVAVLVARYDYLRFGHDLSDRTAAWRIDRGRGEWFFRAGDLADHGPATSAAAQIIDAVHLCHSGPAADWLDRTHLGMLHQLAWNTLVQLYDTPTAHEDLQPLVTRLNHVAGQVRESNRRLYHAAATTGTDRLIARLAAMRDILTAQVTP